jgi:1A family penicillin-binding protein
METWHDPQATFSRRLRDFARSLVEPRRMASVVLAAIFVTALTFAVAWQHCFFDTCPDVSRLTALQPDSSPVLLDRDGHPFADLVQSEQRVTRLHNLPQHVAQAFLAVEDRRFYEHRGIDWQRVGGAMLADIRSGGFGEGFSTLSMQLARNVFPDRIPGQERSARRKLLEIRVAQEIEDSFTKDEILELYLNHIYFGNGAHGIEAAARTYFGVPASQLNLSQTALLAALPKAPTHYDPRRNPERARERRNLVLTLMQRQGRVSAREAREARDAPLGLVTGPALRKDDVGVAPWFVAEVRRQLEEHFGDSLYNQPLLVRTTLDRGVQKAAEEELLAQLKSAEAADGGEAAEPSDPQDDLQGAVVVLRVADGDVLGWVGGRDWAVSQFDRVSHAERQPGSAWKPFVYAAALEAGYPLSQLLADRPLRVRFADGRVWTPKNFSDRYDGEVTLRDALVRSKNVPTVRLATEVGLARVAALAHRAGIAETIPQLPSSVLGTVAVSPLELTAAYTTFAGLGTRVEPRLIQRVERLDGTLVWDPKPRKHPVLSPSVAYLIDDTLGEVLERGSGVAVRRAGFKGAAAGKTGTTNDAADAWFVGYTPEVATGVWIGYDHPRPISAQATGGEIAAPLWGRLMARVYADRPLPAPWKRPTGVVDRRIDPATGRGLASGCAPTQGSPRSELFLAGREPKEVCPDKSGASQQIAARLPDDEEAAPASAPAIPAAPPRKVAGTKAVTKMAAVQTPTAAPKKTPKKTAAPAAVTRIAQVAPKPAAPAAKLAKVNIAKVNVAKTDVARAKKDGAAVKIAQKTPEPLPAPIKTTRSRKPLPPPELDEPADSSAPSAEAVADVHEGPDLSGWWEITNQIESTSYPAYQGLRLTYRVHFEQEGDRLVGKGVKSRENGRSIPASAQTPITLSGTLEGRTARILFTEHGLRRTTQGSFRFKVAPTGETLAGTFASGAADTSGPALGRREG